MVVVALFSCLGDPNGAVDPLPVFDHGLKGLTAIRLLGGIARTAAIRHARNRLLREAIAHAFCLAD